MTHAYTQCACKHAASYCYNNVLQFLKVQCSVLQCITDVDFVLQCITACYSI